MLESYAVQRTSMAFGFDPERHLERRGDTSASERSGH
jgi:hypothetical protein